MQLSKKVQSVPEMIAAEVVKDEVVRKKVSPKQQALAEEVLKESRKPPAERLTRQKVLEKVGYSTTTATAKQAEIYSSQGFIAAMQRQNLAPDDLVNVAQDAMKAKKGTFYRGEYVESDRVDHDAALKGAHFVADILGIKKTINENRNINVNVDKEDIVGLF